MDIGCGLNLMILHFGNTLSAARDIGFFPIFIILVSSYFFIFLSLRIELSIKRVIITHTQLIELNTLYHQGDKTSKKEHELYSRKINQNM
ncbi:hypothetical protein Fmac_007421 [Flemingia macrophylla]|uniref:Uncharacterized protein n=1 Tax=Flemingia macrophylla TaxID=520843 RepID=A0ABD1MV01_9FABA